MLKLIMLTTALLMRGFASFMLGVASVLRWMDGGRHPVRSSSLAPGMQQGAWAGVVGPPAAPYSCEYCGSKLASDCLRCDGCGASAT